jgi:hypothetical protein
MSIHQIRLYDIFRRDLNLPDEKAAALIIALEESEKSQCEKMNQSQVAKMGTIEAIIRNLDTGLGDLKREISDLRKGIEDVRKSMYTGGIVQIITILGGLVVIVKFMK